MALKKHEDPIVSAHSYVMDAYCQYSNPRHPEGARGSRMRDFVGNSFAHVKRLMRDAGWTLSRSCLATCDLCNQELAAARTAKTVKDDT